MSTNSQTNNSWDLFICQHHGSFLQSWTWGEFQEAIGRKVWRLNISGHLLALIVQHNLPLGKNYLYCPYGPVLENGVCQPDVWPDFLIEIKKLLKQEKSIFFRVEPLDNFSLLERGFVKSRALQPTKTIILDLSQSGTELLKEMYPKARYNINLSQRKGIVFKKSSSQEYFNDFWRLLSQTSQRDKFHLHSRGYYQKMLEILGQQNIVNLFLAEFQNRIIAAHLVCCFAQKAIYLHGASDYQFRRLMAPYFLHWQTIYYLKKLGFKSYDLGGIDEQRWPGLTRFKKGFGGQEVVYPGGFDLINQPLWYKIYNSVRKIL